jgi:hypothetical protein
MKLFTGPAAACMKSVGAGRTAAAAVAGLSCGQPPVCNTDKDEGGWIGGKQGVSRGCKDAKNCWVLLDIMADISS